MKLDTKKVAAISISAALVAGGIGAALGAYVANDSVQVAELQAKVAELESQEPVVVTETVTVETETIVEVTNTVEVLVDNENLDVVLQYVFDNNGDVSFVTSGLKESEIDQIVERVLFINDVESLVLETARQNLLDLVHNRQVSGKRIKSSEVTRVRFDENSIVSEVTSFKFNDANGQVTVTFEADGERYEAVVGVTIKNSEVSESKLESIVRI
jgi:outer membrane murein-binding lipoprotein Lpp